MKILHIFKTYHPDTDGGIERVIWELRHRHSQMDVTSHVASLSSNPTYTGGEPEVTSDGRISFRKNFGIKSNDFSWDFFRNFRRLTDRYDLLHFHFPWPTMDIAMLLSGSRKPFIVTYHSDVVRQRYLYELYKPVMHRFLERADHVVTDSQPYLDTSPILKTLDTDVSVIPLGLTEHESQEDSPISERVRDAANKGDFFLSVGLDRHYKGYDVLIEAAEHIPQRVVIAGLNTDSGRLDALVRQKGLTNVEIVGEVSDAEKFYLLNKCKAFVLASRNRAEAYGLCLVEATMQGRAMVTCDVGTGTSFINVDGQTGIVVPNDDPVLLSEALLRIDQDDAFRDACGRNARKRYLDLLQSAEMAERYLALYQRVLDARKA